MKKSSAALFVVISVVIVAIAATPTFAGGRKKKATPTPKHQLPTIASVSANAVTVTDGQATRTFTITQFTEITVNGQKATIAQLRPGMTVSVTIGMDPTHASRINASGAPPQGNEKKK